MRTYEMMAVLAPDIAEAEMPGALERLSGYITTAGGEVSELITTSPWGRRRLAYEIRDYRDGFYALYHFTLDPANIGELERELRLNNQVLRSLVVSYTPPRPKRVRKPQDGAGGEGGEGAESETAASAVPSAPSGAVVDNDAVPAVAVPVGVDTTTPPTAETPETEDDDTE